MNFSEMKCPHCGKTNREKCNTWMYGSPVRTCRNCNKKYLDRRYREVAIDGVDPRSVNSGLYLKGIVFFLAGFVICLAWLLYQINYLGYYHIRLVGCVFVCAFGAVMCIILFIRNKLGIDEEKNARYLEESEKRLADKSYVKELIDYGINVPEKYL